MRLLKPQPMDFMGGNTYKITKPFANEEETRLRLSQAGWELMGGIALPWGPRERAFGFYILRSTADVAAGVQPWISPYEGIQAGERVVDIVPSPTLSAVFEGRSIEGLPLGERLYPDRRQPLPAVGVIGRTMLFGANLQRNDAVQDHHAEIVATREGADISVVVTDVAGSTGIMVGAWQLLNERTA